MAAACATAPAVAIGWHAPDPATHPAEHLATVVLAEALAEGDASRLQDRLLLRDRTAVSVEAYLGTFGDPFEQRDPMLFTVSVTHPPQELPYESMAHVQSPPLNKYELNHDTTTTYEMPYNNVVSEAPMNERPAELPGHTVQR